MSNKLARPIALVSPLRGGKNAILSRLAQCGWIAAFLLLALPGCNLPTTMSKESSTPTPTQVVVGIDPLPKETAASNPPARLVRSESPLRFTLPTPAPQPISLWRPPLYDVPWALGPHDHFYFTRPIAVDEVNWPLPDYRYGGVLFGSENVHTGVDIPAPRHTPVIAAAGGRVVWAGYGLYYGNDDPKDPYGLAVTIRHDFGFDGQRLYTIYAHMDELKVITGQEVKAGDTLGLVGTTGQTTGPHLHFEVRLERNSYFTTYNPELWLAPPQGWGVLAGQLLNTNGSLLTKQDVVVRNKDTGEKWTVSSYGDQRVNSDPYYEENLVLSDLPAGNYEIIIDYQEKRYQQDIEIHPGAVSYFKFRGKLYFNTALPPTPSVDAPTGN